MKFKYLALVSAATLALAGCGQKTQTVTADNNTVSTVNTSDDMTTATTTDNTQVALSPGQMFANAAAASDAFETATSTQALATSTSASVKAFAKKMIDAHTESTVKLKAAAGSASPAIVPDATLTTAQQTALDAMKAKSGADFDAAYIAAQINGHQKTLDKLKAYSATGDVPALKTFATTLVPIVTAHLNMAKGLKA